VQASRIDLQRSALCSNLMVFISAEVARCDSSASGLLFFLTLNCRHWYQAGHALLV
jgi:hypothetical protein